MYPMMATAQWKETVFTETKMPKLIPQEVKLRAMELYLAGNFSAREIAETLTTEYDVEVTTPTIYSWAKKDDWDTQKALAKTKGMQDIAETESQRYARLQEEHLNQYEEVANRAYRELNGLNFDKAIDAIRAVDLGIRGQREVMEGMINLQFVQDVLNVLVEEVKDEDTINKIAIRLKTLVQGK
jgi:transposase